MNIFRAGNVLVRVFFVISLCILSAGQSATADDDGLFGDWAGIKTKLEDKGITLRLEYTGEYINIKDGAIKDGSTYLGNVDFTVELNTEKAGLWKNGKFFAYVLHNHGGNPSGSYIGDIQTSSNIEAPQATRLYEAWYEHSFFDDRVGLLLGQHDLNSEFDVTEYGGLFLNSSFGIQPDISGNVGVSIFPAVGPAARVRWQATDRFLLLGAVYDGDPGNEFDNPKGIKWDINSKDGRMNIVEGQMQFGDQEKGLPGTYKLGGWLHTADFDDVVQTDGAGNAIVHGDNSGVYFIADQMLYREEGNQGLGAFLQLGLAPDDRNEISNYVGLGINYLGLIPGRDDDTFGIGFARAGISDKLQPGRDDAETTWELTYQAQITPWLYLQPDLQLIQNTGADPANRDATVGIVRFGTIF
ncbi:MAG: carbohydrate porin [Candidatus Lindowbacteria bacterium]|nr:carbohydrate porin [Candidatus Lindowbacteria bacterium]